MQRKKNSLHPKRYKKGIEKGKSYCLSRRLEGHLEEVFQVFKDVLKTSWKMRNCYAEFVFISSLQDMSQRRL